MRHKRRSGSLLLRRLKRSEQEHLHRVNGKPIISFIGILLAPWSIQLSNSILTANNAELPLIPVLAAMAIAYSLGEGLGRLGCISYDCCYGKPQKSCSPSRP